MAIEAGSVEFILDATGGAAAPVIGGGAGTGAAGRLARLESEVTFLRGMLGLPGIGGGGRGGRATGTLTARSEAMLLGYARGGRFGPLRPDQEAVRNATGGVTIIDDLPRWGRGRSRALEAAIGAGSRGEKVGGRSTAYAKAGAGRPGLSFPVAARTTASTGFDRRALSAGLGAAKAAGGGNIRTIAGKVFGNAVSRSLGMATLAAFGIGAIGDTLAALGKGSIGVTVGEWVGGFAKSALSAVARGGLYAGAFARGIFSGDMRGSILDAESRFAGVDAGLSVRGFGRYTSERETVWLPEWTERQAAKAKRFAELQAKVMAQIDSARTRYFDQAFNAVWERRVMSGFQWDADGFKQLAISTGIDSAVSSAGRAAMQRARVEAEKEPTQGQGEAP